MSNHRCEVKRASLALALGGMLLVGGVGGWIATEIVAAETRPESLAVAEKNAPSANLDPSSLTEGFRSIVQRALPAVVSVSTTRSVEVDTALTPFFSDGPFRDFFSFDRRFETPREYESAGQGSGVLVSADGYILTNEHVVRDADEIMVVFHDRTERLAEVVGADAKTDIAILKVEGEELPSLPLGDSTSVEVGDLVLAMGNPFGIGSTVTMGIVSATGREGLNPEAYEDFIQTDAAINPGNSGGPLVNTQGEVIGINTAIISRSGGNQGIGFAVPSSMARDVMSQIVERGRVVRGWLGVSIQRVSAPVADVFDLADARGALVGSVELGSPAARAGLEVGDVITRVDEDDVTEVSDLRLMIAQAGPDTEVTLTVIRDGIELDLPVTLGELADPPAVAADNRTGESRVLEGVDVQPLSAQLLRQLGLPADTDGVLVSYVDPVSPAAKAGLERGDVIQELNRQRVTSIGDFESAAKSRGDSAVLLVNRGGRTRYIAVD